MQPHNLQAPPPGAPPIEVPRVEVAAVVKETNNKTTWSGIIAIVGTIMAAVGSAFPNEDWGKILLTIGLILNGSNGVGNILSKDYNTYAQPQPPPGTYIPYRR